MTEATVTVTDGTGVEVVTVGVLGPQGPPAYSPLVEANIRAAHNINFGVSGASLVHQWLSENLDDAYTLVKAGSPVPHQDTDPAPNIIFSGGNGNTLDTVAPVPAVDEFTVFALFRAEDTGQSMGLAGMGDSGNLGSFGTGVESPTQLAVAYASGKVTSAAFADMTTGGYRAVAIRGDATRTTFNVDDDVDEQTGQTNTLDQTPRRWNLAATYDGNFQQRFEGGMAYAYFADAWMDDDAVARVLAYLRSAPVGRYFHEKLGSVEEAIGGITFPVTSVNGQTGEVTVAGGGGIAMPTSPAQHLVANPGVEAGYEWSEGVPTWPGTPDGTLAESCRREDTSEGYDNTGDNGRILYSRIWLQEGIEYSNVIIATGPVAFTWGTDAHNQVGVFPGTVPVSGGDRLAVSPDYEDAAWADRAEFTFALTAPYTPEASGWHYVAWVRDHGAGGTNGRYVAQNGYAHVETLQVPILGGQGSGATLTEVPSSVASDMYPTGIIGGAVPYVRMT